MSKVDFRGGRKPTQPEVTGHQTPTVTSLNVLLPQAGPTWKKKQIRELIIIAFRTSLCCLYSVNMTTDASNT